MVYIILETKRQLFTVDTNRLAILIFYCYFKRRYWNIKFLFFFQIPVIVIALIYTFSYTYKPFIRYFSLFFHFHINIFLDFSKFIFAGKITLLLLIFQEKVKSHLEPDRRKSANSGYSITFEYALVDAISWVVDTLSRSSWLVFNCMFGLSSASWWTKKETFNASFTNYSLLIQQYN